MYKKYPFGIIYKATNLIDNKCYIGQTIRTLHKRKMQHIRDSKQKKFRNKFCITLNNYNDIEWKWEIVHVLNENDDIDELEIKYIRENDSYYNGYNSTFGGNPYRMKWLTEEEKKHRQFILDKVNIKYYYKIFKNSLLIYKNDTLKYFCEDNNINYESFRVAIGHSGYYKDYITERILLSKWNLMNKDEQEIWLRTIPDSVINKINERKANHDKYNYKVFKDNILIAETTNLKNYCQSQQINYRDFDNNIRRRGKFKEYTIERTLIV